MKYLISFLLIIVGIVILEPLTVVAVENLVPESRVEEQTSSDIQATEEASRGIVQGADGVPSEKQESLISEEDIVNPLASNQREFNVTDQVFGANGSDTKSDSTAINRALQMALNSNDPIKVFIPAGNYYIDVPLVIYSNTELVLQQGAKMIRSNDSIIILYSSAKGEPQGGYEDFVNVTISGGIWEGNVTQKDANGHGLAGSNLIYLFHGKNIHIKDTMIQNCCGDHFIDFTAIADSSISNVTFQDFIPKAGIEYGYGMSPEAVHLDYAEEVASAFAKPLDKTPCKNIIIQDCVFNNCPSGIGNHHPETKTCEVKILNNTFNSIDNYTLMLVNFENFVVTGNKTYKTNIFAQIMNGSKGRIENNVVALSAPTRTSGNLINVSGGTSATDSTAVDIINNQFSGKTDNESARLQNAIYVNNASVNIQDNKIIGMGTGGIGIKDASSNIEGNIIKNVTKNGIYVDGGIGTIDNNTIEECGEQGIVAANGIGKLTVSNNTIKSTQFSGINVQSYDADILNNIVSTVRGDGKDGILYIGNTKGTANIQGNHISITKRDGICVYNSIKGISKVTNNTVTSSGRHGIMANISNVLVDNNTVSNVSSDGINITKCNQVITRVSSNEVANAGKHGIIAGTSNLVVERNISYGNGEADIGVYNSSGQVINNGIGVKGVNVSGGTASKSGNYVIGTWEKISGKWHYKYVDGIIPKSDWKQINGSWYYFDKDGWMLTGWKVIGGKWYYFGGADDGKMREGWQKVSSVWYYFGSAGDDNGKMRTGWQKIGIKWYYFGEAGDGKMREGWQKISFVWYYFGGADDGKMREGWQTIGGKRYYFGAIGDGKMQTGWQTIDGKRYYFNSNGTLDG